MLDKGRKIIMGLLAAVSLCAAGYLLWYYAIAAKTEQTYEEARSSAYAERTDSTEQEESRVEIPIDFEKLQAVNEEVYAWIRIEGTNIDYPVVQSLEEDTFYLEHTWEKRQRRRALSLHRHVTRRILQTLIRLYMGIRWETVLTRCFIIWVCIWRRGSWNNIQRLRYIPKSMF